MGDPVVLMNNGETWIAVLGTGCSTRDEMGQYVSAFGGPSDLIRVGTADMVGQSSPRLPESDEERERRENIAKLSPETRQTILDTLSGF